MEMKIMPTPMLLQLKNSLMFDVRMTPKAGDPVSVSVSFPLTFTELPSAEDAVAMQRRKDLVLTPKEECAISWK